MPSQVSSIVKPGASLSAAAQPLSTPHRVEGKYSFQWLYEGPNARLARPSGIVVLSAIVPPALSVQQVVMSYEVPEGYRFVMTDILMSTNATGYSPGQGLMSFTLQVKYSTGPRGVEFFTNLDFPTGRFIAMPGDFETNLSPIRQRLEFAPLDVLQVVINNTGLATPAGTDVAIGILQGFTYPNSESGGG